MTNIERYMHIPSLPLSLTDAKHKIGKKHKKNVGRAKQKGGPVANANPPSKAKTQVIQEQNPDAYLQEAPHHAWPSQASGWQPFPEQGMARQWEGWQCFP